MTSTDPIRAALVDRLRTARSEPLTAAELRASVIAYRDPATLPEWREVIAQTWNAMGLDNEVAAAGRATDLDRAHLGLAPHALVDRVRLLLTTSPKGHPAETDYAAGRRHALAEVLMLLEPVTPYTRPPYVCPQCGPDPAGPDEHAWTRHTMAGMLGEPYPGDGA